MVTPPSPRTPAHIDFTAIYGKQAPQNVQQKKSLFQKFNK